MRYTLFVINARKELISEKVELEKYNESKFHIDEKISITIERIEGLNKELDNLRRANIQKDKLKENENRIKINEEVICDLQKNIDELNNEKKKLKIDTKGSISKINSAVLSVLIILSVISLIAMPNIYLKLFVQIAFVIYCIYLFVKYNKNKQYKKEIRTKQKEFEEIVPDIR